MRSGIFRSGWGWRAEAYDSGYGYTMSRRYLTRRAARRAIDRMVQWLYAPSPEDA